MVTGRVDFFLGGITWGDTDDDNDDDKVDDGKRLLLFPCWPWTCRIIFRARARVTPCSAVQCNGRFPCSAWRRASSSFSCCCCLSLCWRTRSCANCCPSFFAVAAALLRLLGLLLVLWSCCDCLGGGVPLRSGVELWSWDNRLVAGLVVWLLLLLPPTLLCDAVGCSNRLELDNLGMPP